MRGARFAFALWVAASTCVSARADEPGPFAYEKPIRVETDAPIQTLHLDLEVYRGVVASLRDLRVRNAAGRTVPHALRPAPARSRASAEVPVPVFALRGAGDVLALGRIEARVSGEGAIIEIDGAQGSAREPLRGFLIDAGGIEDAVSAIELEFDDGGGEFVSELHVEAGDDLEHFETLAMRATVARLASGPDRIDRRRIDFSPTRRRYVRITFVGERVVAPIAGANAITAPRVDAPPLEEVTWRPERVPGERGALVYDLGGALPVVEVEVMLTGRNALLDVELAARAGPDTGWRVEYAGIVHAIGSGADPSRRAIPISLRRPTGLKLTVKGESGLPQELPDLRIRMRPDELIFVAQGAGPYTLAYGRAGSADTALAATQLLAAAPGGTLDPGPSAKLGPQQIAGGPSALELPDPPLPVRTIALWALLVVIVAIVFTLGLRALAKQGPP